MTMVVGEAEEGQMRNAGCCCWLAVARGVFFLYGALTLLLSICCCCWCCHNCWWTMRWLRIPALRIWGVGVEIQPAAQWRQRAILVLVVVALCCCLLRLPLVEVK